MTKTRTQELEKAMPNRYTVKQIIAKAKNETSGLAVFNPDFIHNYVKDESNVFECFARRSVAASRYLCAGRKLLITIDKSSTPDFIELKLGRARLLPNR